LKWVGVINLSVGQYVYYNGHVMDELVYSRAQTQSSRIFLAAVDVFNCATQWNAPYLEEAITIEPWKTAFFPYLNEVDRLYGFGKVGILLASFACFLTNGIPARSITLNAQFKAVTTQN